MNKLSFSYQRGFTLIELMIVVLITAVLTSLATSSFNKYKGKARATEGVGELRNIHNLQRVYYTETGDFVAGGSGPSASYVEVMTQGSTTYQPDESMTAFGTTDQYFSSYEQLGNPFAVGEKMRFYYRTYAASFDSAGNIELGKGSRRPPIGFGEINVGGDSTCTELDSERLRPQDLGIKQNPGHVYDWVLTIATANQNVSNTARNYGDMLLRSDDPCTFIIQFMERGSENGTDDFAQSSMILVGVHD